MAGQVKASGSQSPRVEDLPQDLQDLIKYHPDVEITDDVVKELSTFTHVAEDSAERVPICSQGLSDQSKIVLKPKACNDHQTWSATPDHLVSDEKTLELIIEAINTRWTNWGGTTVTFPDGKTKQVFRSSYMAGESEGACREAMVKDLGVDSLVNLYDGGFSASSNRMAVSERMYFSELGMDEYLHVMDYEYKLKYVFKGMYKEGAFEGMTEVEFKRLYELFDRWRDIETYNNQIAILNSLGNTKKAESVKQSLADIKPLTPAELEEVKKYAEPVKKRIMETVSDIIYDIAEAPGNTMFHCYGGIHRSGLIYGTIQKCLNKYPDDEVIEEYTCYANSAQDATGETGYHIDNEEVIRDFDCSILESRFQN